MDVGGSGVVRQQRLVAVKKQEHEEIGDIARALGRARAGNELGIMLAAMVKEADQLGEESGQRRRRRTDQRRRDILVVEHDGPVGLHLDDAREAEARVAGALLGLQHVAAGAGARRADGPRLRYRHSRRSPRIRWRHSGRPPRPGRWRPSRNGRAAGSGAPDRRGSCACFPACPAVADDRHPRARRRACRPRGRRGRP